MAFTPLEGVDFSATANADWAGLADALVAGGKHFVWGYAVDDVEPAGRGFTAAGYQTFRSKGLDMGFYYERDSGWMLRGYNEGVSAAQDAQANIVKVGAPPIVPVHFAHDIDPDPAHWAAIDACLNGAASVIGWERVGVYGGWLLIDYMAHGGTVKHLAQTSAWAYGRGLHPAATLYQYAYNAMFAGTNCDLVQALSPNYGQASLYEKGAPVPMPAPVPAPAPKVTYPEGMDAGVAKQMFGSFRASNGVLVQYSETDELAQLWLASGVYGRLVDVMVCVDSPTITRLYWHFSDGRIAWRPNDHEPIRWMKAPGA